MVWRSAWLWPPVGDPHRYARNAGFAAANNHALAGARGELVATVNDDAVVAPGWYGELA